MILEARVFFSFYFRYRCNYLAFSEKKRRSCVGEYPLRLGRRSVCFHAKKFLLSGVDTLGDTRLTTGTYYFMAHVVEESYFGKAPLR